MADLFRKKSISQITQQYNANDQKLVKSLGLKDLISMGIAAVIGAGIFSTVGLASYNGGPGISLLFILVAISCTFTAVCYAQFASIIPVSGSAYTYSYVAFGEIIAWIVGWALLLEYSISNMIVSVSWSQYFVTMCEGFGIKFYDWLVMSPFYAIEAHDKFLSQGLSALNSFEIKALNAYNNAPILFGLRIILDLPAGIITLIVTYLAYRGLNESKNAANLMVIIKVAIIIFVIIAGAFYIKPTNWVPFLPNGFSGVLKGIAPVFFAYIGFDSVTTIAEECKNPKRDLPRAMVYSLFICSFLYILLTLVLTGMVKYDSLNVKDPLAYAFGLVGINYITGLVTITSVIAITGALLVMQVAQPRIWMVMSRDGLMWKRFEKIHPKYKTPSFGTFFVGIIVFIPSILLKMDFFLDLTSVGTFFAFIIVSLGVLVMDYKGMSEKANFRIKYINGKYLVGILLIIFILVRKYLGLINNIESSINWYKHNDVLYVFFIISWIVLSFAAYIYNLSLIPVIAILINIYLMTELGLSNWIMFILWLMIGLCIYFMYGYKNSKLKKLE